MTSKIAQQRAAKATRRKRHTGMKRGPTGHVAASAERSRRWARGPIHSCLMVEGLFEHGLGVVVLARKTGIGEVAMAAFLLDVYCRGVRYAVLDCMSLQEFTYVLDQMGSALPWQAVDASYARKLLREATKYAEPLGFRPPREFAAAEALFGDVSADACDTVFRFGLNGKPCYIPSPTDRPSKVRTTLQRLRKRLGEGGFSFMVPADDLDLLEDEESWDEFLPDEILRDQALPDEVPF
jgi:hypothetical protein